MELTFLGTGAGFPSSDRNVSACVLNLARERNALWLLDCGEGTQRQFLKTPLKLSKIEKIFITHLHGDHLFGLPGLLSTRPFKYGTSRVTVYGPKPIKAFLHAVFQASGTCVSYPVEVVEIEEGIIFEDDRFQVLARKLVHRAESFGFRIVEKDRPGRLDAQRLEECGVQPGPVFQKLKQGETITLENGRTISGSDFISPGQKGKVVAILGDTSPAPAGLLLAEKADLLVHEATYAADLAERAAEHGHSTTVQAARLAHDSQAKKLIITHISSRYKTGMEGSLLAECRAIFPDTEIAEDLKSFTV